MTLHGRVHNGVVVFNSGSPLRDGTRVDVVPVDDISSPSIATPGQKPLYPVSKEQKEALLGLIGMWKAEQPPDDAGVERIIEEERMNRYS
jgi:hypothetical protein